MVIQRAGIGSPLGWDERPDQANVSRRLRGLRCQLWEDQDKKRAVRPYPDAPLSARHCGRHETILPRQKRRDIAWPGQKRRFSYEKRRFWPAADLQGTALPPASLFGLFSSCPDASPTSVRVATSHAEPEVGQRLRKSPWPGQIRRLSQEVRTKWPTNALHAAGPVALPGGSARRVAKRYESHFTRDIEADRQELPPPGTPSRSAPGHGGWPKNCLGGRASSP